jgi:hypothetical protein
MKNGCMLVLLVFSVLLNIFFLIDLTNQPSYKLGILSKNIYVTDFYKGKKLFTLPKGMTVMNASPRGIASAGLFGVDRFTFVIIEEGHNMVNYSPDKSELSEALYSGNPNP